MNWEIGVILVVAVCPLGWVISYGWGRWMLSPLYEAEREPEARTQFRIPDLYVLLVHSFLLCCFLFPGTDRRALAESPLALPVLALGWGFIAWSWWVGVRVLSRAGIRSTPRRLVALGIAVPIGFGSLPVMVLLTPTLMDVLAIYNAVEGGVIVILLLCLLFATGRSLAQWAAGESDPETAR